MAGIRHQPRIDERAESDGRQAQMASHATTSIASSQVLRDGAMFDFVLEDPLTERREHLNQLAPERGRISCSEPHALRVQQLAQNCIHEIERGLGAVVARVRKSPRQSTPSALARSRGFASICVESLWIRPLPKA
jgi:hypothetical protein